MKFTVERDVLADAVAWAARSLPVRPSVPVLAGLLIETGRGRRRPAAVHLRLRDLRPGHAARRRSQDEGKALVSGRLLADICRSLPNKPVEMTIDGAKVSLTCGSARFSLQTMPVEEYPTLPDMPQATGTVRSDLFANAVAQAVTAAGRDDMLPVLTGVRIEIEGSAISLLATDRFRLSLRELEWDPGATDVVGRRAGPGQGARRHRQVADLRHRGDDRAGRLRRRRGHHRLRGRGRRRRTTDHHPAPRRRVPQGPHAVPRRARHRRAGRPGHAGRVGQAGLAGRRAQHRRPAGVRRRAC